MFQELGWERHVAKLSASRLINSNCHWLPAESAALRRFCYSFLKEPVGQEELVEASSSVCVRASPTLHLQTGFLQIE